MLLTRRPVYEIMLWLHMVAKGCFVNLVQHCYRYNDTKLFVSSVKFWDYSFDLCSFFSISVQTKFTSNYTFSSLVLPHFFYQL